VQITQSITDVITRSELSNESRRRVLCSLQWCNRSLRETSKYCIAVIKSVQHKRGDESSGDAWSEQFADLLETSDVVEAQTHNFIMTVLCNSSVIDRYIGFLCANILFQRTCQSDGLCSVSEAWCGIVQYRLTDNRYKSRIFCNYTVSQKNATDVAQYNFNPHQLILLIFRRDIAARVHYQNVIFYLTSALPGETWTQEIIVFSVMLYTVSRKWRCFSLLYL